MTGLEIEVAKYMLEEMQYIPNLPADESFEFVMDTIIDDEKEDI